MKADTATLVGIDVGGERKGFHAVALQYGTFVATLAHSDPAVIVRWCRQLNAVVVALETQLASFRATAANLLSALVTELTGTPHNGKISVPSVSTTGSLGRPRKSA